MSISEAQAAAEREVMDLRRRVAVAEGRAEDLRDALHDLILYARGNDHVLGKIHGAIRADENAERNEFRRGREAGRDA